MTTALTRAGRLLWRQQRRAAQPCTPTISTRSRPLHLPAHFPYLYPRHAPALPSAPASRSCLLAPLASLLSPPRRHAHMTIGHNSKDSDAASASLVDIPSFISPPALASLLGVTLRRLAKDARKSFPDWWPQSITERRMLRTGYSNVKALVLNYTEAAAIARLYDRHPQRKIMEGSDLERPPHTRPIQRAPCIAILGHKDHGKTTLLDSLRGTDVAQREEFGITQETYTFQVTLDELSVASERQRVQSSAPIAGRRRTFTFLDTPGHHSFSEMRTQAAAHADVVLLVVAADEGLLDQTFEALNIVTDLTLPLVVAITKTALPTARVAEVRRELQRLGARLVDPAQPVVSRKGQMVAVEVSVKEGVGLQSFRQALFGVTSLLPLTADANAICLGGVVESFKEEKGRGDVVRVLVKEGTLRVGDYFVSDLAGGKVKAMRNCRREPVMECGPGDVCEVMGSDALPAPGSDFFVCSAAASEAIRAVRRLEHSYPEQDRFAKPNRKARANAEEVKHGEESTAPPAVAEQEDGEDAAQPPRSRARVVPSFFSAPRPSDRPLATPPSAAPATPYEALRANDDYDPLPVVIKASSVGQLRMLTDSIDVINADLKIPLIQVVESSVGVVTKTDIQYAQAYECPIYCFRVKQPLERERASLRRFNIPVLYYAHFQHLIDQITANMTRQYDSRRMKEGKPPIFGAVDTRPVAVREAGERSEGEVIRESMSPVKDVTQERVQAA